MNDLLADIEAFLAVTHIPPSIFGRMAMGDPNFVHDLRNGRGVLVRTEERVRKFMREYRPSSRGGGK